MYLRSQETTLYNIHALQGREAPEAIAVLARIDRETTGWVRILLYGLLRIGFGLAWMVLFFLLLSNLVPGLLKPAVDFTLATRPGWQLGVRGYHPEPGPQFQADLLIFNEEGPRLGSSQVSLFVWIPWIGLSAYLLTRSKGLKKRLDDHSLWPGQNPPPAPLRVILRVAEKMAQLSIALTATFFAALTMLGFVRFLVDLAVVIEYIWRDIDIYLNHLQDVWPFAAGIAAVLLAAGITILRGGAARLGMGILVAGTALGLADLGLTFYAISHGYNLELLQDLLINRAEWLYPGRVSGLGGASRISYQIAGFWFNDVVFYIAAALALAYPLRLVPRLANLGYPSFPLLREAIFFIKTTAQVRVETWQALRRFKQSNLKNTAGDCWASVCSTDLVRFETERYPLSYYQQVSVSRCPVCKRDKPVYTGVECLTLVLDRRMEQPILQYGPGLWINSQPFLAQDKPLPVFDAAVIGEATDTDIEEFVVHYNNQALSPLHKKPGQIPVRIAQNCVVEENMLRTLRKSFMQVLTGYDPHITPNPAVGSVRIREAVNKGARQVSRTALRVVRLAAILLVLSGIGYFVLTQNPAIRIELERFLANTGYGLKQAGENAQTFFNNLGR